MDFNISLPKTIDQCMPQSACSFYQGYYEMSTDMGALLIRFGLLILALDVVHTLLKNLFEQIIIPYFRKQKRN